MELINYSLKIKNKELFEDVNLEFDNNTICHLLGNNGCGKSSFGKTCVGMLRYEGSIVGNDNAILISSGSNVPGEFCIKDIQELLQKRYPIKKIKLLYELLGLDKVSNVLSVDKMSDGQKQKVKLYSFLSADNDIIILDEFTNALDKTSTLELYDFFKMYIKEFGGSIINITHNLSDLEYLEGNYYYVLEKKIIKMDSKQHVIEKYVKGE